MPLSGKVAVVTGSSGGIGAAIAETLASAGACVVLSARRLEELEKVKARIEAEVGSDRVIICKADVTKRDEMKALVASAEDAFGPVDIMVNNAGESSQPAISLLSTRTTPNPTHDAQQLCCFFQIVIGLADNIELAGNNSISNIKAHT